MKSRIFVIIVTMFIALTALITLFSTFEGIASGIRSQALAAPAESDPPVVSGIEPSSTPNDLDVPIIVTGIGFTAEISGSLVISQPQAYLGSNALENVTWVSSSTLEATLPWGLEPGVYTLTVQNPDGEMATLPKAFTVTQGIGVWNASQLYGGSVASVVVNPNDPTTLFANTGAGLFRSQDSAGWWDLHSFKVHTLVYDPVVMNQIYAEGNPHNGGFLWRSDDGGDTWIPLTTTFPITNTNERWCWSQIKIHPSPNALYVSDCGGDPGGVSEAGLLKSIDNGESWELVTTGMTDTQISALAFDPVDPLTMYAGTTNGNIYFSNNGGDSWTFASRPVDYVANIAVAPYDDHAVWVSAAHWYGDPCGMYKSADATLTSWTLIGEPAGNPGHTWCASRMFFAPATWPAAYSRTLHILSEGDLFTTTDDGVNLGTLPLGKLSGQIQSLALHPTDAQTIYAGGHGAWDGFYKSTDGGLNWQVANQGLTAIVPEQLLVSPDDPQEVYARSLGKIYRGIQGGSVWQQSPISAVMTMMFDPFRTTRLYAGMNEGIAISDDRGQTWPTFITMTRPAELSECGLWVNPFSASPAEPGVLVAASIHFGFTPECAEARGHLWRSSNYGEDWTRLELGMPISQVNDIVFDPITPTLMYAAIGNGNEKGAQILKSEDAGLTWAPAGVWQLAGRPTNLTIEPGSHRIFMVVNALMPIYISDDFGATWDPLPFGGGHNISDILFAPWLPRVLYDAAQQGLYRSADSGQTWEKAAGALGQVPIYTMAFAQTENRNILYVSTTGGYVDQSGNQSANIVNEQGPASIFSGGVYRQTLTFYQLFLPLSAR